GEIRWRWFVGDDESTVASPEEKRRLGHPAIGPGAIVNVPVGHEQIKTAIAVGIERGHAKTCLGPAGRVEAGAQRCVDKEPAAQVVEEGARFVDEVCDKQVDSAVAVEIIGDHAHAGGRAPGSIKRDSRLFTDFLEAEPAQVTKQKIP